MKLKDHIETGKWSGEVKIEIINPEFTKTIDHPNAITPDARVIASRLLGLDSNYKIDTIALYYLGNLVAQEEVTISFPANQNQVRFQSTFDYSSFSGTFQDLRLVASAFGSFSETSLNSSITKANNQKIGITWTITIA